MGGQTSKVYDLNERLNASDEEIVKLMLPVYYTDLEVTEADAALVKQTWDEILHDKAPNFLNGKAEEGVIFPHLSCISMFFEAFYARLFDVNPSCRPLFISGLKVQGKFLVKMISLAISLLDDEVKFQQKMESLADAHNNRGIKAIEYGMIGDVLFFSLHHCLGAHYTAQVHCGWVAIFSRMLRYIVPIAVHFEIRSAGQFQDLRLNPVKAATDSDNSNAFSSSISHSMSLYSKDKK